MKGGSCGKLVHRERDELMGDDLPAILVRLNCLEQQNRWLKRIGSVALLIALAAVVMGQAAPGKGNQQADADWPKRVIRAGTVQANRIEVVTPSGNIRAELKDTGDGGSALTMFYDLENQRKAAISLSSWPAGGVLQVGDDLNVREDGYPTLTSSSAKVELTGFEGATGMLSLNDDGGKQTAIMGASFLNLSADAPKLRVGRVDNYSTTIGAADLVLSSGKKRRTSAASILLFDPKGNVMWSADQDAVLLDYAKQSQMRLLQNKLDDLERDFVRFRDGACPALRAARLGWEKELKLTDACGLH